MFKRYQKNSPAPAPKAVPDAPAANVAQTPDAAPKPAPSAAPDLKPKVAAKAEPMSREERRKQRLLDLRLEMHTRLLENLNLGAIENAPEADLRREIAAICSDGLQEQGVVLTKDERGQLFGEMYDEVTGLGPL
ncbi:MAG: CpaF family protein, partial [Pseudomonadota bacterium]